DAAVADVRAGRAAAVVTNPINKDALYRAGFRHPGHTEYLAELAGAAAGAVMMLASPQVRAVPVTVHPALRPAVGQLPGAAMFHAAARSGYDAALCMYHDQALIPVKTIDFDGAVNVTLGLPFIRTSPDHGTAFDIAGTGIARPDSLIAALRLAAAMAARRHVI